MPLVIHDTTPAGVMTITLNDADNLNAMSEAMAEEFATVVKATVQSAAAPRAVVLTGAGRAFSAGGHLEMLERKRELSQQENKQRMLEFYRSFLSLRQFKCPLVARINGHAIGAGLCLALACDIRIATERAKLGLTFAKLGLFPGMGATFFLPRIIGQSRALELLISARVLESSEAERMGLVSQVVAASELDRALDALLTEIFQSGPQTVAALLHELRGDEGALAAALDKEADKQSESYASTEFAEGVRAAIEKRRPVFV